MNAPFALLFTFVHVHVINFIMMSKVYVHFLYSVRNVGSQKIGAAVPGFSESFVNPFE